MACRRCGETMGWCDLPACPRRISPAERRARIDSARQSQPLDVLAKKRDIAARRGYWTQEHLDRAKAEAERMIGAIKWK